VLMGRPSSSPGTPAITPHINLGDVDLPTFTETDVHDYVETHTLIGEGSRSTGPWRVVRVAFGDIWRDRRICRVDVAGFARGASVGAFVKGPGERTQLIFDMRTGNFLGIWHEIKDSR
jgi:hypothetical protein